MPKVSIIISSYNHGKFIRKTIESVLNQNFQDFELLIADDASTDNTKEIINNYLSDKRISFFCFKQNREEHMKNYCLKHAKGEYIAILNSDDLYHPEKIAKQLSYLENNPTIGAAFTQVAWIDEEGNELIKKNTSFATENKTRFEWLRQFFLDGFSLCHSSVMIRKELLDKIGPYNRWLALVSDLDLWIRIAMETELYILPEVLTYNRQLNGEKNASGSRPDIHNRYFFEYYQLMDYYYSDKMLPLLSSIFPEIENLASNEQKKQKLSLALFATTTNNASCKLYGLQQIYSIFKQSSTSELTNLFGQTILQEYYKVTSSTAILPFIKPIIQVNWANSKGMLIKTDQILYESGNTNSYMFNYPDINDLDSFEIHLLNSPLTLIIEDCTTLNSKLNTCADHLPTLIKNGDYISLTKDKSKTIIAVLGTTFSLAQKCYRKAEAKSLLLKFTFRTDPTLANIKEYIQTPIQNLDDISASKLLNSLVKKLFKRKSSLS